MAEGVRVDNAASMSIVAEAPAQMVGGGGNAVGKGGLLARRAQRAQHHRGDTCGRRLIDVPAEIVSRAKVFLPAPRGGADLKARRCIAASSAAARLGIRSERRLFETSCEHVTSYNARGLGEEI